MFYREGLGSVGCTPGSGTSASVRPEPQALLMGCSVRLSSLWKYLSLKRVWIVLSHLPRGLQGSSATHPCRALPSGGSGLRSSLYLGPGTCPRGAALF